MVERAMDLLPSTPSASAAIAQTREGLPSSSAIAEPEIHWPGENTDFFLGDGVRHAVHAQPYERQVGDPVYRPLKIFTLDPSVSRMEGAVAVVNVPYEPLKPGPESALFVVDNHDGWQDLRYRRANLDDPAVLIRSGHEPSVSDPQFHQQMVYAVCSTVYAAFRKALGRYTSWGFITSQTHHEHRTRLKIRPHAAHDRNAYYDKERGELCFGYYRAEQKVAGSNLPSGFVFTCLSHDIIAHELTHALLDGLRARFSEPSGPDVISFHEAFADVIAIFQHFSYEKILQAAIRKTQGNLEKAKLLGDIGRQFGDTTGPMKSLRSAIEDTSSPTPYDASAEPHLLGQVLVSAIFDAFTTIFKRKTERYLRLATGGTGILPPGELPTDLQTILATEASQTASQFLSICIRAIDYCPPVDIEFGDFLRAVITADYDLVPDDPWGYREAWVDAFRRRLVYPRHVSNLSEDALRWKPARKPIPDISDLGFAELKFDGDPGRPAGAAELRRQACALGRVISHPDYTEVFGLAREDDSRLGQDKVDLPCVESIRSSRRVGPDGQIVFDLVAEVTQRRIVRDQNGNPEFDFYGGATVILGPKGEIRYVISKNVLSEDRLARQRAFMQGENGQRFWEMTDGKRTPRANLFRLLDG